MDLLVLQKYSIYVRHENFNQNLVHSKKHYYDTVTNRNKPWFPGITKH